MSILSLSRCYDDRAHVDEELYPASNETNPVLKNKKVCKVRSTCVQLSVTVQTIAIRSDGPLYTLGHFLPVTSVVVKLIKMCKIRVIG